jgi:hypothetical protein
MLIKCNSCRCALTSAEIDQADNCLLCGGAVANKNWFVANDKGELGGHDMSKAKADSLAEDLREREPNEGWEAICADEN